MSPEAAVSAYNTALHAIRNWRELYGDGQKLEQFHELPLTTRSRWTLRARPAKAMRLCSHQRIP